MLITLPISYIVYLGTIPEWLVEIIIMNIDLPNFRSESVLRYDLLLVIPYVMNYMQCGHVIFQWDKQNEYRHTGGLQSKSGAIYCILRELRVFNVEEKFKSWPNAKCNKKNIAVWGREESNGLEKKEIWVLIPVLSLPWVKFLCLGLLLFFFVCFSYLICNQITMSVPFRSDL